MKTETCQPRIDGLRVNDVMHRGVSCVSKRRACRRWRRRWLGSASTASSSRATVAKEGVFGGSCPTWISWRRPQSAIWTIRALAGTGTTPVVTVSPNESLRRSAQLMTEHNTAHLVVAGHYLPDLVYGANDGIITTFAVVSGVVGASLSVRVIVILGLANLVADGFSMGASNYLARRSHVQEELADRRDSLRHAFATIVGFVVAGVLPLIAYLVPLEPEVRFPASIALAGAALFAVGAARTFVTRRGLLRSGIEMLFVGALAAVVAFGIGAFAASFAERPAVVFRNPAATRTDTEIEHEFKDDVLERTLWIDIGKVDVRVQDGVAALTGRLNTRSDVDLLNRSVARVPGVIAIEPSVVWSVGDTTRKGQRSLEQPVR